MTPVPPYNSTLKSPSSAKAVQEGVAVLVVSSELPELIPLCDRIAVVRNGAISGELLKKDFSEERILKLAMPEHGGTLNGQHNAKQEGTL
jgi:ABC-type multidrug transport system ATPase subunit